MVPSNLGAGGPDWAGGLDQLTSRVPSNLNHSVILTTFPALLSVPYA